MEKNCLVCGRKFDSAGRGRPRETCSQECHRLLKNKQREESRQRAKQRGVPDGMHGTSSGYTWYKCTCNQCKLWSRTYKQAQRKKPHEGEPSCPTPSPPHLRSSSAAPATTSLKPEPTSTG